MCPQHRNQVKSEQNGLSNGVGGGGGGAMLAPKKKIIVQEGGGNLPTCKVKFQYLSTLCGGVMLERTIASQ